MGMKKSDHVLLPTMMSLKQINTNTVVHCTDPGKLPCLLLLVLICFCYFNLIQRLKTAGQMTVLTRHRSEKSVGINYRNFLWFVYTNIDYAA